MHASCADAETNGRRSRLHPTHSILPYMCCAGPGSHGISRIECFLVLKKEKKGSTTGWSYSRIAILFQLPLLLARSFDFKQRTLVITSHCETFSEILRYVQPTDSPRKGVNLAVGAAPRMPIEKGPSLHGTLPLPPHRRHRPIALAHT